MPVPANLIQRNLTAQRIRDRRKTRGLTWRSLAAAVESSPKDIGFWENKNRPPSADKLVKLADALDTTTDYILGRTDDPRTLNQFKADLIHALSI